MDVSVCVRMCVCVRMAVYSWGRGEDGQLGLGDTSDQYRPVLVDALQERRIVQIACGSGHTVVLTDEGEVFTWGRGDDGRLGHGDNGWKFVPRLVEELRGRNIRHVTCGSYHTAAVTVSGDLYTWGGGMYGKLGHGNETGHSTPYLVESLKGLQVKQVACGSRHTVVLLENKDVYTWGDKENGVSGNGDTEGQQYLPCNVEELRGKNIKQISACGFHTAALTGTDTWTRLFINISFVALGCVWVPKLKNECLWLTHSRLSDAVCRIWRGIHVRRRQVWAPGAQLGAQPVGRALRGRARGQARQASGVRRVPHGGGHGDRRGVHVGRG